MHAEHTDANQVLRDIDEAQIRSGLPILSVVVVHDDGSPNSVTMESIRKYGLAYEGEDTDDTIARLTDEARNWYRRAH
jgi:hypothetical protein